MRTNFFFALAGIFLIQIVQGTSETDIRCHSNGIYYENLNRCDCTDTNYTGIHCHIKRTACQKNECGKATSCDVVNNVATCTCVEPPTGYEWDAKCKTLRSTPFMPEGNVSSFFLGQDSIEDAKYTITFSFNANELCEDTANGTTGLFTCNNTLFSSYEKNTTDSTTSTHVLRTTFSPDSLISKLNTFGLLNTEASFDGQFSKSYIVITSGNFRDSIYSAWNLTDLGVDIEVNIALENCTSNACDGHVAGCVKDKTDNPICTCKDGWEFSNGTLTNVCKDRVQKTCENNGNYYMNDNVVACDCNHLPEWQGEFCSIRTTDCGGVGAHGCMHDSVCEKKSNTTGITDHDDKYTCDCKDGFIGKFCEYNHYDWQTSFESGVPYIKQFSAIETATTSHFWVVFAGKGPTRTTDFFFETDSTRNRDVKIEAKLCQPDGSCNSFYNVTHDAINKEDHGYYYFEIFVSNRTQTELNSNCSVDETISIEVTVTDASPTAVSRRDIKTWKDFQEEQKNSTISPRFAIVAQIAQCETNTCSNRGECQLHYGTTPICVCEDGYEGIRCHLESQKDDSFPVWAIGLIATLGGLGIIALLMYICKNMGKGGIGYVQV